MVRQWAARRSQPWRWQQQQKQRLGEKAAGSQYCAPLCRAAIGTTVGPVGSICHSATSPLHVPACPTLHGTAPLDQTPPELAQNSPVRCIIIWDAPLVQLRIQLLVHRDVPKRCAPSVRRGQAGGRLKYEVIGAQQQRPQRARAPGQRRLQHCVRRARCPPAVLSGAVGHLQGRGLLVAGPIGCTAGTSKKVQGQVSRSGPASLPRHAL